MTFDLLSNQLFVIGNPISHSISPQMHQVVLDQLNLNLKYGAMLITDESELGLFFEMLRLSKVKGVNVTVPYKQVVCRYLDELDLPSSRCGAVNTILNSNGKLLGYNTDGDGFISSLYHDLNLDVKGKKVVVLGAGGAAKGIVLALCEAGISSCTILNRTTITAKKLRYDMESFYKIPFYVGGMQCEPHSDEWNYLKDADIIIQTTSVGMSLGDCPLTSFSWLNSSQICIDIIYNPSETTFLKNSKVCGAVTLNGAGMLAGQGSLAFKLFTGLDADYFLMKEVVTNG